MAGREAETAPASRLYKSGNLVESRAISTATYRVNAPQYGFNVDLHDHNAIQG